MPSLKKRLDHLINHVEMHNAFNHTSTEILDQLRKLKSFVQEQQQQQ